MPTNTYTALATQTLGTAESSVTFTSIPAGYTDLQIVYDLTVASADYILLRVGNGSIDSASNYSATRLIGNGSSATSGRSSGATYIQFSDVINTSRNNGILQLQNYSNTSTFKTVLARANTPVTTGGDTGSTAASVGLWRSTSAINTIQILTFAGSNFAIGSTFTIYGIAATSVGAKATGGTVYSDDLYYYHAFAGSGTFTPTQSITADVLCVAGGGGGGHAGGGAGGLLGFTAQSLTTTGYTVTVGAGGPLNTYGSSQAQVYASAGGNSQFGGLTASVGGGGGGNQNSNNGTGGNGGSGGGEGYGRLTNSAGTGTSGQGFAGGLGKSDLSTYTVGGGGGGAGAVGTAATGNNAAGNGGNGATYNTLVGGTAGPYSFINAMGAATGTGELVSGNYYYAGGGAGSWGGTAGYGGGGVSPAISSGVGGAGKVNTGGGGSGGDPSGGGAGGSGIVIVRYLKA